MDFVELTYQFFSDLEKILAPAEIHSYSIPATLVVACVIFAYVAIPAPASMFRDFSRELELEELDEIFDPSEPDRPSIDP